MGCDAGIMLTASHNPYQDNGIKIFGSDGYKLNDQLELEIEKMILADELPHPEGDLGKAIRIDDAMGRYIEFTKNAVGSQFSKWAENCGRLRQRRSLLRRPADL